MKNIIQFISVLLVVALCIAGINIPGRAVVFSDVSTDTAEGRAIYAVVAQGAISGYSDGSFAPDAPISAADYIKLLEHLRHVSFTSTEEAMQKALDAGWYDWDEIPPTDPARYEQGLARELAASILVRAFFGTVEYSWDVSGQISDFSSVGGRYYMGVLGGITTGAIPHTPGTPFYPRSDLTRGAACLWAYCAENESTDSPDASVPPVQVSPSPSPAATAGPVLTGSGGVSSNGWLRVEGTQLVNERGETVVLRGMSSMGIQWYPQYTNLRSIENTVQKGANVFRIAMYTEEGGYLSDKPKYRALVEQIVQNAIQADVYVIIDWHILSDGNPMSHLDEALTFFSEMSTKYADVPNVLYEICNEPNGNITWARDVKPYAEQVTAAIRRHSNGIVLIGSPMWDQDVDTAAADPVRGTNLMYTLHFYAGTHHQELRDKGTRALQMGAPIFVSEWGTSSADGSGGVFLSSADEWIAWMNQNNLSWCNWSLCDKNETSAALVPGCPSDTVWNQFDLTESGNYVFAHFGRRADPSAPVNAQSLTASEVAAQFGAREGYTVRLVRNGNVLAGNDIVGTGCVVEVCDNVTEAVVEQATVVVYGDVTGSGVMGLTQLVRVAQAYQGTRPLFGPYLAAAEFGGDTGITLTDLVKMSRILTHGEKLTCSFLPTLETSRARAAAQAGSGFGEGVGR